MNWEAVTAIAESIGVIGVIVSLVYLAIQVRHSNQVAEDAAFKSTLELSISSHHEMIEGAIAAGAQGIRDGRLAPYVEDAYSRWSKRLSRMQIVVGAVAFLLFLIYLATGGLGGGG